MAVTIVFCELEITAGGLKRMRPWLNTQERTSVIQIVLLAPSHRMGDSEI